jgi:hypothetical protein
MHKSEFEQVLQEKLELLDKQKQPERDLWPGVELALVKQGDRESNIPNLNEKSAITLGNSRYWVRAAVLAATFAIIALVSWKGVLSNVHMISGDKLVAALSAQHEEQKNALLVQFEGKSALTNNWQQQLAELDSAAKAIKKALLNEPDNIALLRMLQSVHQQQINLIERVHSPKWSQI